MTLFDILGVQKEYMGELLELINISNKVNEYRWF